MTLTLVPLPTHSSEAKKVPSTPSPSLSCQVISHTPGEVNQVLTAEVISMHERFLERNRALNLSVFEILKEHSCSSDY